MDEATELASLGFISDPQRKPMNWASMPKKRKYGNRAVKRPPSQTAAARYKREQRARWIAQGIVTPRSPEEYALLEAANRMDRLPMLRQVGSGPLAMWVAEQAAA